MGADDEGRRQPSPYSTRDSALAHIAELRVMLAKLHDRQLDLLDDMAAEIAKRAKSGGPI